MTVHADPHGERWAEALSVLEQRPPAAAASRLRRQRTRTRVIVAMTLGLCTAVGFVVAAFVLPPFDDGTGPVAVWRRTASSSLVVVGLVVQGVGVVGMARAGQRGSRWRWPSSVLTRPQRRLLTRQVLGRAPADARLLPLTRDLAEHLAGSRVLLVLYSGMVVMQTGQVLIHTAWGWYAVTYLLVVLFAVASVTTERQARSARRFLRAHLASASEPLVEES